MKCIMATKPEGPEPILPVGRAWYHTMVQFNKECSTVVQEVQEIPEQEPQQSTRADFVYDPWEDKKFR